LDGGLLPDPADVSVTFPGLPAAISAVRKVVADVMAGSPRADDVVLIACEYATNAIRHSPSGLPGGEFTLRIWIRTGWVRIEVIDLGTGDWMPALARFDEENGRGLIVVAALSEIWGHAGGRAWAEIGWPGA
jgi:anti-sigma regulatory factor (Ser/Thr protein kinase)